MAQKQILETLQTVGLERKLVHCAVGYRSGHASSERSKEQCDEVDEACELAQETDFLRR